MEKNTVIQASTGALQRPYALFVGPSPSSPSPASDSVVGNCVGKQISNGEAHIHLRTPTDCLLYEQLRGQFADAQSVARLLAMTVP